MKVYFWAFINFKQNNHVKLLQIAEFAYKNSKNTNINYTPIKLNCGFYSHVSHKENVNPKFKSKTTNKLAAKLRELIVICRENF